MLGFTKRTCHFIKDTRKRRSLYISLVRSNFEHGSIIWRPITETEISDFEKLEKKALKWILNEENMHYDDETYITKCCQANLTPMEIFFDINDLTFFHKIDMKMFQYYYPNTLNYIGDRADCDRLITIRSVTYVLLLLVRTHQPDPHFISHSFTE